MLSDAFALRPVVDDEGNVVEGLMKCESKLVAKGGDNVDIGVGAKIIGGVTIADNIKIGANAVVTKSFYEEGITLVGVPARKLERSLNENPER